MSLRASALEQITARHYRKSVELKDLLKVTGVKIQQYRRIRSEMGYTIEFIELQKKYKNIAEELAIMEELRKVLDIMSDAANFVQNKEDVLQPFSREISTQTDQEFGSNPSKRQRQ